MCQVPSVRYTRDVHPPSTDSTPRVIPSQLGCHVDQQTLSHHCIAGLCLQADHAMSTAWVQVRALVDAVTGLVTHSRHVAARVAAIKLVEVAALLYTAESAPPLPGAPLQ